MAKTQKNVIDFLSRLNARLEQRALKELEVLNQLKRQELEELHLVSDQPTFFQELTHSLARSFAHKE